MPTTGVNALQCIRFIKLCMIIQYIILCDGTYVAQFNNLLTYTSIPGFAVAQCSFYVRVEQPYVNGK